MDALEIGTSGKDPLQPLSWPSTNAVKFHRRKHFRSSLFLTNCRTIRVAPFLFCKRQPQRSNPQATMDAPINALANNTTMEDVREEISVLLKQEEKHYLCRDYMSHERTTLPLHQQIVQECANVVTDMSVGSPNKDSSMLKSHSMASVSDVRDLHAAHAAQQAVPDEHSFTFWRQQMFDWACMVVDSFGIDREAVALSFNMLDRYVDKESAQPHSPAITRDDFQLFSMTCLYLAVKILEPYPRKLPVQTLVDMSKNFYSREVIESTEVDILRTLEWRIHAPTAMRYCRLYMQLFPKDISYRMQATCLTLVETAIADSFFVSFKPSLVGLAAFTHAAHMEGMSESSIQKFYNNLKDIIPTRENASFMTAYLQLEKQYAH
jgi:hypothetical protein